MTKLVVFLGNMGSQFKGTRHNAGWMVCEKMVVNGIIPENWLTKFHSLYCKVGNIVFLKPQTYMNNSGIAVQEASKFYNIKPEEILVVHDDIELKFGELKLQLGGGMGGHNGLRSIKQNLNTDQFKRLRIGVGRPEDSNTHMDVATWVTAHFTEPETKLLDDITQKACDLVQHA